MALTRLERWERKLRQVFDGIDDVLEEKYGGRYPLHPSRPRRGTTSSKKADGLFHISAAYTAGFGSTHGEGYVVEVRMVTLARVPKTLRTQIEAEVAALAQARLPKYFPGRNLRVEQDGRLYKIVGDLDLTGV
jgi:hypothetical protein